MPEWINGQYYRYIPAHVEAVADVFHCDLGASNIFFCALGATNTIALVRESSGAVFAIRLQQDGAGNRTVTWFDGINWAGGSPPTLTTTADKADTVAFVRTSAGTYDGFVVGQNN